MHGKLLLTALTMAAIGTVGSAFGQTTVYEQSRTGGGTQVSNPDFTYTGAFTATASSDKSTAPGLPAGSTGSRFVGTPSTSATSFTVSPNHTTAGQLVVGTSYAVAVTFGNNNISTPVSPDITVATTDSGTTGLDTFVGTSTAFQRGNGYNIWITIGNVTISGATPTFTFTWSGGTTASTRWYVDSVRFLPLAAGPTAQYWDNGGLGGTATWDTTTTNWNPASDGSGVNTFYNQANLADFGGTAGTVTITGSGITTDGGLEFDANGYTVQGGTLTLGLGTNIAVASGVSTTINSVIAGTNGLTTTGLGNLVLGASNTLTGTVTLTSGTLSLATNQTFTSLAGNATGTLALNTNTLTVGDSNNTTCASIITDAGTATPGTLIKQGSGILSLNGTSTYHGKTVLNGGVLAIGADAALGTAPTSSVASQLTISNGARLDFTSTFTFNSKRGITLGTGGGVISDSGTGITPLLQCNITGPGSLTIPSGGFDISGNNTFTGNLYLTGSIVDTGGNNLTSIRFASSTAGGKGKIFVMPTNAFNMTLRTFAVANVLLTNAIELDAFPGAGIFLTGGLNSGANCTITFSGNINGNSPVFIGNSFAGGESNPGGTVVLSGSNSLWSGAVNFQVGTLGVGSSNALGTGNLNITPISQSNLVLYATTPLTGASALGNPVTINLSQGASSAPLTIGGTNGLELAGSVFLFNNSTTFTVTNTGSTILSGQIANSSTNVSGYSITVNGGSPLTFKGSNTYDGGTFINSSGILLVNNTTGSGTGSGPVSVAFGSTVGGTGTISSTVDVSGTIAPGSGAPGTLSTGGETWEAGGSYTFNINQAGGTAGSGWSQASINGALAINAFSGNPFVINLTSLTPANAPGNVSDFNSAHSYTWSIAHTTGGITGFDPTAFTLNTAGFANSLGSGTFSITTNATDVLLKFVAPAGGSSIGTITVNGTSLTITGSGGTPSASYRVLASTNVSQALTNWIPVGTNNFDGSGNFSFSGTVSPTVPQKFYIIVSP